MVCVHDVVLTIHEGTSVCKCIFLFATCRSDQILYSFLSVGIGLISDCDIESEKIRFVGDVRFALWGILRHVTTM